MSPGSYYCSLKKPKFAISVIFDPGYYLAPALAKFEAGTMRVGVTQNFFMGRGVVPTVQYCGGGPNQVKLTKLIHRIGSGALNVTPLVNATKLPSS